MENAVSFSEVWESARYNDYYWWSHVPLWIATPMLFVIGLLRGNTLKRRMIKVAVIVIALFFMLDLYSRSIILKWHLRSVAAQTSDEKQEVADRDGANIVMGPLFAIPGGIAYFLVVGVASSIICRRLRPDIYPLQKLGALNSDELRD